MIAGEPLDKETDCLEMRDFIVKSMQAGRTPKTTLRDIKFAFPELQEEAPDPDKLLPSSDGRKE